MRDLEGFLASENFLDMFRRDMRRHSRMHLPGEHLTRRLGQSLEFRDHHRFSFGDDVRHIDWRVSSRTPPRLAEWDRWHIRRFVAEEHMKIVISLDARATMFHPQVPRRGLFARHATLNGSKLQAAFWLAQAIAYIALSQRDRVTLHRLFGAPLEARKLSAGATVPQIAQEALAIIGGEAQPETLQLNGLDEYLKTAAVWIILTDLYYDSEAEHPDWYRLVERMHQARQDHVWTLLVDFDSWPAEAAHLRSGSAAKEVEGPAGGRVRLTVGEGVLDDVRRKINRVKTEFRAAAYSAWEWPENARPLAESDAMQHFCQDCLLNDPELRQLFMRDE